MRNIKLGTKLVLVGVIILLIPLVLLGFFSINKASDGLKSVARAELVKRTEEIAYSIDNNLMKEEKVLLSLAVRSDVISALSGETGYESINTDLHRIAATPAIADSYQMLGIINRDGITRAASSDDYLNLNVSDRDYFQDAMKGKLNIGMYAFNKVTGEPFVPIAAPVYGRNGEVSGAVVAIFNMSFLWELVRNSTVGQTGYTFVTDVDGTFIAHPDPSVLYETGIKESDGMEIVTQRFLNGESGWEHYIYKGVPKTTGFAIVPRTGWGVFLAQPDSEFLQSTLEIRQIVLLVAAISFAAAFVIFLLFARSITTPVKKIVGFANDIAEGVLYTEIDVKTKDEIGSLADSLRNMQDKLSDVVARVIDTSNQVSSGSLQLSQSAEQLSSGATEQASNAEEVSSSVEQMGANIQQNTDNAAKTEEISSQAAVDMENGGNAVLEAVEAMNQIAQKINIIEDIARQTNMLSLNAAIEAARAGEHGKGFAVVASEVGKLAAVSQKAAAEIQELTKESVDKANTAGEKIQSIVPDIRKTAELITEISASSHEQNSGAEQINSAMIQLDQVIQQNAAASEEVSSMSEELSGQAEMLKQMVAFFKLRTTDQQPQSGVARKVSTAAPKPAARPAQKNLPAPEEYKEDTLDDDFEEF